MDMANRMDMAWMSFPPHNPNAWDALGATTLHITPTDDLIGHDTGGYEDCICGPRTELVETNNGDRWLVIHHSLDGRERKSA